MASDLIVVRAAGINATETKLRRGLLSGPDELPQTTGRDVAGVVDELGPGVSGVAVGDRVFGVSDDGAGAAAFALLTYHAPIPTLLGFVDAAALPVALETATRGLDELGLTAGQNLVINGAAGGIGSTAVQLAVARGLRVIGTASAANHDYLRLLGAEPVTYGDGLGERLRALAPAGVDAALDVAGGGVLPVLIELAGGPDRVVTLADVAGAQETGVRFSTGAGGHAFHALAEVGALIASGRFWLPVERTFPLDQIAEAHRISETGHVRPTGAAGRPGVKRRGLSYRAPLDWASARRLIGAHAVPGSEVLADDGSVSRMITTAAGAVPIRVWPTGEVIMVEHPDHADPAEIDVLVRHWLDLDLDPEDIRRALGDDPRIGGLINSGPGLRRIGYPNAYEAVILTVLGQQVSLAAGRTFAARLVAAYGRPGDAGLISFPRAEDLITVDEDELRASIGLTRARTRTLRTVAEAFADDPAFVVAGPQSASARDAAAHRLVELRGIGPWTVQYLRMRLLGDPDALPASDLVLRRALQDVSAAEVTALAEPWRPWRSYAVLHLWSTMAWA